MEKIKNILVFIILIIVAVALYQTFIVNSNLRQAINTLDSANKKLDLAAEEISYSKARVDSLQKNFARFSAYIKDVQGRLERMDLEKRINEQAFVAKRDSIRIRLKELNKTVDLTGQDLPEVPIIDTKKPQLP
jgi:chromosome segregation ATPase